MLFLNIFFELSLAILSIFLLNSKLGRPRKTSAWFPPIFTQIRSQEVQKTPKSAFPHIFYIILHTVYYYEWGYANWVHIGIYTWRMFSGSFLDCFRRLPDISRTFQDIFLEIHFSDFTRKHVSRSLIFLRFFLGPGRFKQVWEAARITSSKDHATCPSWCRVMAKNPPIGSNN